jgi:hypothetical protein
LSRLRPAVLLRCRTDAKQGHARARARVHASWRPMKADGSHLQAYLSPSISAQRSTSRANTAGNWRRASVGRSEVLRRRFFLSRAAKEAKSCAAGFLSATFESCAVCPRCYNLLTASKSSGLASRASQEIVPIPSPTTLSPPKSSHLSYDRGTQPSTTAHSCAHTTGTAVTMRPFLPRLAPVRRANPYTAKPTRGGACARSVAPALSHTSRPRAPRAACAVLAVRVHALRHTLVCKVPGRGAGRTPASHASSTSPTGTRAGVPERRPQASPPRHP